MSLQTLSQLSTVNFLALKMSNIFSTELIQIKNLAIVLIF